jgi:acetyl-CoA C-acetyltransferase
MADSYIPILVGAAQYTQAKDIKSPLDPLGLMINACRSALNNTGVSKLKDLIDTVYVVNLFQWSYRDAPGMLCKSLGLRPEKRYYTPIGGNTPQMLVHRAARSLACGDSKAVLMAGAEAIYSFRREIKGDVVLDWPQCEPPERIEGDDLPGVNDLEVAYDLYLPSHVYPLFETALRAASGRNPGEHKIFMARLWAQLSEIASRNPYSWIKTPQSVDQIAEVTRENRYIGYPYTKSMNANLNVDQSAALIMTTQEVAMSLGISPSKWVYPLGGADFNDVWNFSRRPKLHESPAVRNAAQIALDQAGIGLDDINVFDLYSCFPSAVKIAQKEIGIPQDDPRDLSVTGGLAYFGGPGNNYTMHAIASVVDLIRQNRSMKAMVTANGLYITKHSIGIYGGSPPKNRWEMRDDSSVQRDIDAQALPEPVAVAEGNLTVEAYVIRHDRDGDPEKGTVLGHLRDGRRALAHIDATVDVLLKMEETELVGRVGDVRYDQNISLNLVSFPEFS